MAATAALFEQIHGRVLRAPSYDVLVTAGSLHSKIPERMAIETFSEQAVKTWIQKYRGVAIAVPEGIEHLSCYLCVLILVIELLELLL